MRSISTLLLACSCLLLIHCDNSTETADPVVTDTRSTTLEAAETEETLSVEPAPAAHTFTVVSKPAGTGPGSTAIDEEIARLLEEDPELPVVHFPGPPGTTTEVTTFEVFSGLASATGGAAFNIDAADQIIGTIQKVLTEYMSENVDLVLVIDKTGSMSDDLAKIQESATLITKYASAYPGTRIGYAFYGDKNSETDWFSMQELTDDFSAWTKTIKKMKTSGGGDTPESVYDGIAVTINKMNWGEGRRRVILLLGDAPSHEKPKSRYDLNEIITMAKDQKVNMNFYPVIIGVKNTYHSTITASETRIAAAETEIISSLQPNPATNMTLLKLTSSSEYTVEVFDISGKLLDTKNFTDNNIPIYTDTYPTGVYIVRIIDNVNKSIDTRKLVVRK